MFFLIIYYLDWHRAFIHFYYILDAPVMLADVLVMLSVVLLLSFHNYANHVCHSITLCRLRGCATNKWIIF